MDNIRITCESDIDAATIERFLAIYRRAYGPLERLAAARQSLTDDEFREEMTDPRVLKWVAWDDANDVGALSNMAADLTIVPWISPAYFEARFPEHYARGAVYYFGALLVRPELAGGPYTGRLLDEMVRFIARHRAVAAFDCCSFNVDEVQVPAMVAASADRLCHFEPHEVDVQRYYAYVSSGPREPEADVDLVAAETAERADTRARAARAGVADAVRTGSTP